jgi:hypothetical protein
VNTRVAALRRGPYAGVIGFASRVRPGSDVWTFRLQRPDSKTWHVQTADLYLFEDAQPVYVRVGAWRIELNPLQGEAIAWRPESNLTHSAPLTRFPNGWKVSTVWSTHIPASVQRAAERLARGLTK